MSVVDVQQLLDDSEQQQTIDEIWRVLRPGGLCLIECRGFAEATDADVATGVRTGPGSRIEWGVVDGMRIAHYRHDDHSFAALCQHSGIASFSVYKARWGGRERLFLHIDRSPTR